MPFGDRFARAARAPLELSCTSFNGARMGDGIRRLERASLETALQQGVSEVASEVGVPALEVSSRLPLAELQAALERLQKRQEKGLRAIRRQEMTVATFAMPDELPTAPSASEHLKALSQLFARDKEISASLRDLSFEVAAWEALLQRSADLLDADEGLRRRARRRQQVRWLSRAAAGLVVVLLVTVAPLTLWQRQRAAAERAAAEARALAARQEASARAEAALRSADACAPDGLDEAARALLTEPQREGLAGRVHRCQAQREIEARQRQCASLAAHLAAGTLSDADRAAAGPAAPALQRAAQLALTPADLQLDLATLPCSDPATRAAALAQLTRAAAGAGLTLWGLADGVSADLARSLAAPGVLALKTAQTIAFRAESVATGALLSARPDDRERARSLCSLKQALGQALAMSCDKILKL